MPSLSAKQVSDRLVEAKSYEDVDAIVMQMVAEGELPDFIENVDGWPTLTIKENGHVLKIRHSPTYAVLGTDSYPIGRATPFLTQALAKRLRSVMPSRKLVDLIEKATGRIPYIDVKAKPWNVPGDKIQTQVALDVAAAALRQKLSDLGLSPSEAGFSHRKSKVSAPKLDGSQVGIEGGRWTLGGKTVQPFSTIHSAKDYSDDSHGEGPFICELAELDGKTVQIVDEVFMSPDPAIASMVNDYHSTKTGLLERYIPEFPNASKDTATFAMMDGDDDTDFSGFAISLPGGGIVVKPKSEGRPSSPDPVWALGGGATGALAGFAVGGPPGAVVGVVVGTGLGALASLRRK